MSSLESSLGEDRDLGLEHRQLQDLVALLLAAGEALVHVRWTIASSIPSRSICSFMLAERQALIRSSFTDWYAVRRKFTTDTPGTSVGY